MEAQRFPDDYDGIIAGAPAANWSRFQTGGHLWVASALNKDPERYIPAGKLRLLQDAVVAACDANDGVRDGVLDDPRRCAFDPQTLVCAGGADGELHVSHACGRDVYPLSVRRPSCPCARSHAATPGG
jgi:tannase/feruloyl esterase